MVVCKHEALQPWQGQHPQCDDAVQLRSVAACNIQFSVLLIGLWQQARHHAPILHILCLAG